MKSAEKAVWQRNILKSYTSGISKPEFVSRKPQVPATSKGLEEEVTGKQQELESLARSLEQGREVLSELRRSHLVSVPQTIYNIHWSNIRQGRYFSQLCTNTTSFLGEFCSEIKHIFPS